LHTVYKALTPEDVELIIAYCHDHTIQNGGLFEVYPDPDGSVTTVVVNSRRKNEPLERFRPVGAFFCNYLGPGVISLEDEDPHYDGMESGKNHIKAIKQTIDTITFTTQRGYSPMRR
jgi:hypothetical protein